MFSGEGDWCSTVLGTRALGLECTLENGSGAVPNLLVNSDESRQLFSSKIWKTFWLLLSAENYRFYRFYLDKT